MRKKIISIALSMSMAVVLLTGCGGNDAPTTGTAIVEDTNAISEVDDSLEIERMQSIYDGRAVDDTELTIQPSVKTEVTKEYETLEINDENSSKVNEIGSKIGDIIDKVESDVTEKTFEQAKVTAYELAKELNQLYQNGDILDFGYTEVNCWYIDLYGVGVVYQPEVEGVSFGIGDVSVKTYEPCLDGFLNRGDDISYHVITDNAGTQVDDKYETCVFDTNLDNEAVCIDALMEIKDTSVILWEGHGAMCGSQPGLVIGERFSSEADLCEKHPDINGIWLSYDSDKNDYKGIITHDFIVNHMQNLDGSLVYLNTCYSAFSYEGLIDAFAEKGVGAFIGNSYAIYTYYCNLMLDEIINLMTQKNPDTDSLYTIEEAILSAREKYGNTDVEWLIEQYGGVPAEDKVAASVVTTKPNFSFADFAEVDCPLEDGLYHVSNAGAELTDDHRLIFIGPAYKHIYNEDEGWWDYEEINFESDKTELKVPKGCKLESYNYDAINDVDLHEVHTYKQMKNQIVGKYAAILVLTIKNGKLKSIVNPGS